MPSQGSKQTLRAFSRRKTFLCAVMMLGCLSVPAARTAAGNASGVEDSADEDKELWFTVGESFSYRLQWGVLPVGTGRIWTEWVQHDGRRLLAIRGVARTGRIVENIYPIENDVVTLVDPKTFLPLTYRQRIREGRRRRHETTVFNHAEGYAEYTCHRRNRSKQIEICEDTRDLMSLFYIARREAIPIGQASSYRVLVDDEVYDLTLTAQEFENVSLPGYGNTRALRIEPTAMFGEVFLRKGKMWVWLSHDQQRVCMKISASIPVANVHAVLTDVSGPVKNRWTDPK